VQLQCEPMTSLISKPNRGRALVRSGARGVTLIEVLIVMAILALVVGGVLIGSGQMDSSRMHHSSTMMAGAVRVGFSRSASSSKTVRLVMDFAENEIWLEEGDQPHLVQTKDLTGTGGASAATEAEKQAVEDTSRIVKGPTAPRTSFREIDAMGLATSQPGKGHKKLDGNITFYKVQTGHDDQPRTEGRAYLYFWPGGQTERAAITLRIKKSENEKDAMTLIVAPLTGKVTVKPGVVELPRVEGDKD
jgi:general secretion pathway protein H